MRVLFYKRVCHTHTCVNTVRTLPLNISVTHFSTFITPHAKKISVEQILNVLSKFKFAGVLCESPSRLFCSDSHSDAAFHFCPDC